MSSTKTLLNSTLESFLENKKEWISHQSVINPSAAIALESSYGDESGVKTYAPPSDGFILIDVTTQSAGSVYVHSRCLTYRVVPSNERIAMWLPVRKGLNVAFDYPPVARKIITFWKVTGQS